MLGGNPSTQEEHDKVASLGGLAIIGTERHESRRIDNQLRGRSGRQGDPGSSRFYLSLEDNLLRLFGSEKIQPLMGKLGLKDGEAIESSMLSRIIENSQKKVEEMHFDIRKQLLAYDNVMNQQREAVYAERSDILTTPEDDMPQYGWDVVHGVVNGILDQYFPEGGECEGERAAARLRALFGKGAEGRIAGVDTRLDMEGMRQEILDGVKSRYDAKIAAMNADSGIEGVNVAGNIVRHILLNTLDSAWRQHLLGMDELRLGIGLRAIGQKDPLIEYQFESYNLFTDMMERVKDTFTEQIFRIRVMTERARTERKMSLERPEFMTNNTPAQREPARKLPKVGRNDPCPCGSGKKYKYCHGRGL